MNVHDEMSDDEVLRAASEFLSAIPVANPPDVEAIMARGDAHTRRGNRRVATGITACAASVALVLGLGLSGVLGSASHPPSHPAHAQLAAWTVVKQADGTILVKIREFRDPAGLQAKLRADGIPASVEFNPANLEGKGAWAIVHFAGNPCQEYSGGEGQAQNVVTGGSPFTVGMFVHPSAIPSGAGLQFVADSNIGYATPGSQGDLYEWLVQTSPQCTGS
jgi:hypothetical protein